MAIPKTLYRYEGINAYSLKNLKAQSLYMASPLGFNDPYDCALSIGINEISDEGLGRLKSHYANREGLGSAEKQEFLSLSNSEMKAAFIGTVKSAIETDKQSFLERRGVSCFSEKNDDLLMWAHYADCYRGFCLEFDTQSTLFNKAIQVTYVPRIPVTDIVSWVIKRDVDHLNLLYGTKSINWQHEKEWRVIHKEVGTSYGYPAEALKAIYFGPKIDVQILEIICLIIQGQNDKVEFWRGKLSKTEFKVEFEKFRYAPYLMAKKAGLSS